MTRPQFPGRSGDPGADYDRHQSYCEAVAAFERAEGTTRCTECLLARDAENLRKLDGRLLCTDGDRCFFAALKARRAS